MTDLENCLRRDLSKIAERVTEDSIRPLRVRRTRRTRRARLLAPIAAMAAVVAVIAGVSLAAHTGQAPAPATQAGLPLYYVTVTESTDLQRRTSLIATVHDSVNGAVLARSSFPGMPVAADDPLQITGGGDNGQTFVISVDLDLFMLRVASDGRSMQFSRFSIPWHPVGNLQLDGIALSPDGTTLAITASGNCNLSPTCVYDVLHVVSLTTGAAKTWSTQTTSNTANTIYEVGWAGNDHVVFDGIGSSAWLLNVTGSRGGSLSAARVLPVPAPQGNNLASLPLVTPDGSTIFLTTSNPPSGPESIEKIIEISVRTGKMTRVLDSTPWIQNQIVPTSCVVYALAATGVHALIGCENVFGRLDNGKFTRLPGKAAYNQSAAW